MLISRVFLFMCLLFSSLSWGQRLDIKMEYDKIKNEATKLAGDAEKDVPRRATLLHDIYEDSDGNHVFPLMALHGALWAHRFFNTNEFIADLILGPYSSGVSELLGLEQTKAALMDVNKLVFIDTYTNYYFSKKFGSYKDANKFLPAPVLNQLNEIHVARELGNKLPQADLIKAYRIFFSHEQNTLVSSKIIAAFSRLPEGFVKDKIKSPRVRFEFFPQDLHFKFNDFSDVKQRIYFGNRALEIAFQVGLREVEESMRYYDSLPRSYFRDRSGYVEKLKKKILK